MILQYLLFEVEVIELHVVFCTVCESLHRAKSYDLALCDVNAISCSFSLNGFNYSVKRCLLIVCHVAGNLSILLAVYVIGVFLGWMAGFLI